MVMNIRFGKRGHTLGSPEAAAAAGLPVDFEELPAAQHQQVTDLYN